MKWHCIIHANFEQPSYYEKWAQNNGFDVSSTHLYKGETLPCVTEFDFLLSMGGPQSPLKIDKFPYLKDEIQLITEAIKADKYIIGVCLGAQLIAESYGAHTQRSPHREIGVFPVSLTEAAKQDPIFKHFPDTFQTAHWHNDMPGLPSKAQVIATSDGCPRQIIRFAPKVIGFQCHLEFDKNCVNELISNCPKDLRADTYVQTTDVMLSENYDDINAHLKLFLDLFTNIEGKPE